MTGGLIQLVAIGIQDVELTGNPTNTLFKTVYPRFTSFSQEEFEQAFSGPMSFESRNDVKIDRRGDLMAGMTLEFDLTPNNLSIDCDFDTMANELHNIAYLTQQHQRAVAAESIDTPLFTSAQAEKLTNIPLNSYVNKRFTHYAPKTGHILVDSVELQIGGQRIDKQYGEWMELWSQMTSTANKQQLLANMISIDNSQDGRLYVPLRFWFCQNPGLALPLVALQYHEVWLFVTICGRKELESVYFHYIEDLETISQISTSGATDTLGAEIITQLAAKFSGGSLPTSTQLQNLMGIERMALYVNYIYLETEERRRFAQEPHKYIITQTQLNSSNTVPAGGTHINVPINFNHPVKQLVWSVKNMTNCGENQFNYWNGNRPGPTQSPYLSNSINSGLRYGDQLESVELQMNGAERFQPRRGAYFRVVQPYYYNTGATNYLAENIFYGKPGMEVSMAQAMVGTLENVTADNLTQGSFSINRKLQGGSTMQGGFYTYSFAYMPELDKPTGTCNFSRLDSATLILELYPSNDGTGTSIARSVNVYALNYNQLNIQNGMGGVAYSN